jgi:hypothetical protein
MREQKSTNQVPSSDQERFGGHHSLARDAKPIALRLMALPGNCLDGMEEIEVPEPCETVEKATGNRWNFLGAGLGGRVVLFFGVAPVRLAASADISRAT